MTASDADKPRIVLPPLEVDAIAHVKDSQRNHPMRDARVSAATARANAIRQAAWIEHEAAPRRALRSLHLYVAAALMVVAAGAIALRGQPSEVNAKVADALNLQDAVAQAALASTTRK